MPEFDPQPTASHALIRPQDSALPVPQVPVNEWQTMGEAFDGLCKAGLALTVGFSVAAVFCKMMDQKKLDVPQLVSKMAGVFFTSPAATPSATDEATSSGDGDQKPR